MDFSHAIQLIAKSKHVGLVLPREPDHDALASAEVLARFLSSRSIYVGLVAAHQNAHASADTFPSLASLAPLTKELIVSLDTSSAPISQLRYENTDKEVNIILSPSSSSVMQDHITFREGSTQCDCLISLGAGGKDEIDAPSLHIDPLLISQTPVIALDITPSRKPSAELDLIDTSFSSLTELTYRFLADIRDYTLPSESATLLLSGILHRTDNFIKLTGATTLLASHELIQLGADLERAHTMSRIQTPISLMSLVGRALARSKMDEEKEILWSSITRDDFLATHRTSSDARDVLDHVVKEFPGKRAYILLAQDPITQKIAARIAAPAVLLRALYDTTQGNLENAHFRVSESYNSFPDAQNHITALLADVV